MLKKKIQMIPRNNYCHIVLFKATAPMHMNEAHQHRHLLLLILHMGLSTFNDVKKLALNLFHVVFKYEYVLYWK